MFGREREEFIARSKIVLNTHFWPESSLETHRIEYLMARGKCVVSERSMDRDLDEEYSKAVNFCTYDSVEETITMLLRSPEKIENSGRRARVLSENHQFNMKPLRKALEGCSLVPRESKPKALVKLVEPENKENIECAA